MDACARFPLRRSDQFDCHLPQRCCDNAVFKVAYSLLVHERSCHAQSYFSLIGQPN